MPELVKAASVALSLGLLTLGACRATEHGTERLTIPEGATLQATADTLAAHDVIRWPGLFSLYARIRGQDERIKAGTYELPRGAGWSEALDALVSGRVVTVPVTIPEGWTLTQIAEKLASLVAVSADSVRQRLTDTTLAESLDVPGPTLEGYLFPDTYRFAEGVPLTAVIEEMVQHYRGVWTPTRRAVLDSMGWTEREIITLASIVQAEARWEDEMPTIAAVYHNRLSRGMRLQADPTVQYALEARKSRLLYADIDAVADHPYNTYTHAGLPPGPIGSPGLAAIEAALHPVDAPYLYFVARDDGRHEFSRTLREHNRAVQELRRRRRERRNEG